MININVFQVAVVYDGQCGLCTQSVRLIRRLDRHGVVEYIDAQNRVNVTARWPALDLDALLGQIHVITPDGAVYVGYQGVRRLTRVLPTVRLIAPALGWPGIAWLGDKVYRWVAAHRYQFNRLFGKPNVCADGTCAIHTARPG